MRKPYLTALSNVVRDGTQTISNFRGLADFIKENKLWEGVLKYTWLSKFLILVGLVGSFSFIHFVYNYWSDSQTAIQINTAGFTSALGGFFSEGYDLFVLGGLKYLILILMEVVIFHFARRTLEVKTGETIDTSLKVFIEAQIRMIKVVFYSWLMETIVTFIVVKVAFSILGLHSMDTIVTMLIQCYFLGFAVIDNYNEIYKMTIKQSFRYTMQYGTVAFLIGFVVYLIMLIPLAGTLMGPLLGAVVGTITMYELHQIDRNMDWVFIPKAKASKG